MRTMVIVLAVPLLVGCRRSTGPGTGETAVEWRGSDRGRLTAAATAAHCPETGVVEVLAIRGDTGFGLAMFLKDSAVLIEGATNDDEREALFRRWRRGEAQTLITKPSMFGFGLNLQFCHRVFFLGIGHSYEQYYQAVRRCWRFGQSSPVDVRIVVSEAEVGVAANVRRKEQEAAQMAEGIVMHMKGAMDDELHHGKAAPVQVHTFHRLHPLGGALRVEHHRGNGGRGCGDVDVGGQVNYDVGRSRRPTTETATWPARQTQSPARGAVGVTTGR